METSITAGKTSPAIKGNCSTQQVLEKLLNGTGLNLKSLDSRTVAVAPAQKTGGVEKSKGQGDGALRIAQNADTPAPPGSGEGASKSDSSLEQSGPSKESKGIPEILVTGSRLLDMDIKRTIDDPQPYVIFEREQITQSGAASLEDFLKNRLTMNTVAGTNAQDLRTLNGNQSQINLRGLGTNQTLILIDGHRTSSVNNQGCHGQFDINGIPLAAIERIEIQPTTASAIYGGGATGGAVNIVLRRDYGIP